MLASASIILAAGASTRMGRAKQLLAIQGETLLARACRFAREAGFSPVVVVTGARRQAIEAAVPPFAQRVYNPGWEAGMGGSVSTGLSYALQLQPGLESAGFLLTDQPYLDAALLEGMQQALRAEPSALGVAAAYRGSIGVPAIFRQPLFEELLDLHGAQGAKPVLLRHKSELLAYPFAKGAFDLDRPEDWDIFLSKR